MMPFSGFDTAVITCDDTSYSFKHLKHYTESLAASSLLCIPWPQLCMNNVCCFSLLSCHGERKKTPTGPLGQLCQGHLSATVFRCVRLHSSQHAGWLHKTLSAIKCPTAGRLRLHQSCCAGPIQVPLPPVPDSLHQLSAHLSSSLPRCYLFLKRHRRAVWEDNCMLASISQQVLLVSRCVCACLVEWQRGRL